MPEHATETELVAELNDLLQLDHDAVGAYTLAMEKAQSEEIRQQLIRFRGDHQRHIRDLTHAIRAHGGAPTEMPHMPTGAFKLAVQAVGMAGGDRALLLAFKANEGQVRDKYLRAADGAHPRDVAELLERNAADEVTHYTWVSETLEQMGAGPESTAGRAEAAFERVHGRAADMMEGAEREMMEGAESLRRSVPGGAIPWGTIAAVVVAGLVFRKLLR